MPFPLEEVFGPGQIRHIPKMLRTVEDVAVADWGDIPVKKSWEYVLAAQRYCAHMLTERIWKEDETIVVRTKFDLSEWYIAQSSPQKKVAVK